MNLDKFLKILWLVNGIGLLILLISIAVIAASEIDLFPDYKYDSYSKVESNGDESFRLTYNEPELIYSTENYLLAVGVERFEPSEGKSYSDNAYYSDGRYHASVNVIFLDKNLKPQKTLLDRKAYISEFTFPTINMYDDSDTTARNMIYLIAFQDTNEDGTIDFSDNTDLYISDLSGNNLQQITRNMVVSQYNFIQQGQKLRIDYLKKDDVEGVRHFALYDIANHKLEELVALDQTLNSVKTLYKP